MQLASSSLYSEGTQDGWEANLALRFARRGSRTSLVERRHRGPLKVQRPFYPEGDVCHLYLLHPPGGLVGGDRLHIKVEVEEGAAAMLTTPGAAKFYRSLGPSAEQHQVLRISDRASLEWLPQENILFPGANALLSTQIDLSATARFIGWEISCLGLPANRQRFESGRADLQLRIDRDGEPLLWDRLRVQGADDLDGSSSLRGMPVVGTLIATGADEETLQLARSAATPDDRTLLGITRIDDLLVARALGQTTDQVRAKLTAIWASIRPALLGRPATPPRIWAT
ncbi:urease accessory protein UreD [Thiorhodococcus mannitoliphagus]|uniref:Urease accessory protein UreD n=1 Tax=Thiorhodococcus mannitoliphagus TaxID=329406 RepID=A0A6P1DU53_9GAMM|nr:urease accessory protein UreD [Thiorhodococcus mannitoliphagus]NEX19224.1 urease accessory protein UreD [Thiorhodococcus mannitoliphagus]